LTEQDVRICFVGDSFVQGTCDPECLGWPGRVCRAAMKNGFDVTCYNLGVRRDTSADILRRWQAECVPRLPQGCEGHVMFSFGNNDTTLEGGVTRVPELESIRNAECILRDAKRLYRAAMVGPPPILDPEQNERTRRLSVAFEGIARTLGVPYLSVFDQLVGDPVWTAELTRNDGSHPGRGGYDRLAKLVLGWEGWWFH
jgi:lysophospholipase L1-like esterase